MAADAAGTLAERRGEAPGESVRLTGSNCGANGRYRLALRERGASRRLADILADASPTVLVQLAVSESATQPRRSGRYDTVIADTVTAAVRLWQARGGQPRRLVVLSSTVVYGLARSSPLLFHESDDDGPAELGADTRYGRWAAEMKRAERSYGELAADLRLRLTLLRSAPVVGGPLSSPVNEFLASPVAVRVIGYDPPVQVVHYRDLLEAIVLAVEQGPSETLNIASRGVVPLSRLGALAGRVVLPLPRVVAAIAAADAVTTSALAWRCVADDRRAAQVLGFLPAYSAEEAVRG